MLLKWQKIIGAVLMASFVLISCPSYSETELYVTTRSYHYQNNSSYNNNNYGIYLENGDYVLGFYNNSFGRNVGLFAYRLADMYQSEDLRLSFDLGGAVGYKQSPLIVMPALTLDAWRGRVTVTPVVVNFSFKVVEW